jgi:alkylation response protein AidB-like acyl-CoA dehydrogenase
MQDWDLTDEQRMIRRNIREFAEAEIRPRARELDKRGEFSPDLARQMGELGLFGMTVPEEYGGAGMDTKSYIIAVEELARVDGSQAAAVAAGNSLGINPLYYFGSEEQRRRYLPELCRGPRHLFGFGLTEPGSGSDAAGARTTACPDGDDFVINGSKIFITNAGTELTIGTIVMCKLADRDRSEASRGGRPVYVCLLVENGTPGYTVKKMEDKMLWRASNTCELYFDDVRVPKANLLGSVGDGFKIMLRILDGGRLSIAAMGLGAAQGAFEIALRYAQQREQFGQPIAKFQAVSFKLADMATEIDHARAYLYRVCDMRDKGLPYTQESAMTKLACGELAGRVTDAAMQILGGYSVMPEYEVERYWRDQRILQIGEGTSEIQRLVIARTLGCL